VITMSLAEIAKAVGGELVAGEPAGAAGIEVTGRVEFDSRQIGPGGLFLAFPGASVDGHDYAAAAAARGAVAVLGNRPTVLPTIVVADTLAATGRLARAMLDRLPELTVVAITGSSGKTSTKDMIAQVLRRLGPTVAAAGSLNNELGLPYTVLSADPKTRFLVLEMGSRGIGHLRYLCLIAPPTVAAVLNVGPAHIGEFGSIDAIAAAKGELVEALRPGGLAVLNADDPRVAAMAVRTQARVVLVGEAETADVRAVEVRLDERGRPGYQLVTAAGAVPVRLGLIGRHQVGNSLTAAAIGLAMGLSLAETGVALGELRPLSTRRMDVFDRPDGVTVIDDSYNANPASVEAALRALIAMSKGRRTVAVLGYLAELGAHERAGHEAAGRLAAELGVDRLVVVGQPAAGMHHGAQSSADWGGVSVLVADQDGAVDWLRGQLRTSDVVLVKGSRYRTWQVADALRDLAVVPAVAR
jgi:UDP-N-acetylmuramoyl-tripeptide--D-alanyl-D-alanine ligase